MAISAGPNIVEDDLILNTDPINLEKNLTTNTSTNFLQNGSFSGGTGVTYESGSNPTNTIVELENPGDSQYVVRQNGNNTEYHMNIDGGAQGTLSASTQYVMSGWYAKSSDYNGGDTMFHARAHSSGGSHNATGNGIGTLLYSKVVGGLTWQFRYQVITTPSDYDGNFDWYMGFGTNNTAGYRYYTGLKVEEGSFPSSLDLSRNSNDGKVKGATFYSDGYFTFDGTDDFISAGAISGSFTSFTVIVWFYPTSVTSYENSIDCNYSYNGTTGNIGPRLEMNNSGTLGWIYSNITNSNDSYYNHGVVSSGLAANTWHCAAITYNGGTNTSTTYFNGNASGLSRSTIGSPTGFVGVMNNVTIGKGFHLGGSERIFTGRVSNVSIYNKVLTAAEVKQNFNALRGRFGI